MTKKNFFLCMPLMVLACSCSSTSYSYRKSDIENHDVLTGEVVVDIKLNFTKKIEATSSPRNTVEEAKQEAYYKAITQNNVDVIVDPIYEVTTIDSFLFFGGTNTAKVVGYGAVYANPRTKVEAINELGKTENANVNKFNSIYPAASEAPSSPSLQSLFSNFKK
ncbi:MAG: hypothetical protein CFE24_01235 [Flavobacterium sp. BFFFF2]|nr:MAG: hypothetical protein CFE24_01235 [Flavobacterium sp. BFFFF2]